MNLGLRVTELVSQIVCDTTSTDHFILIVSFIKVSWYLKAERNILHALEQALESIDENILSKDDSNISKVLLFGDDSFNDAKTASVLTASVEHILSTKRFDVPLYQNWHLSICLYAVYF